jgi:hypothetical protein
MPSAIRYFSAVTGTDLIAAAEFGKVVHLYRAGTAKPIKTIYTNLDFGGHRLQLAPHEGILVAGAYHVHGIEGFDLKTGNRCWSRRDLKKVQSIRRDPQTGNISCFFEGMAGQILHPRSGTCVSKYRGVKDVFFSDYAPLRLEERGKLYRVSSAGNACFEIRAESFGILDACFSKKIAAVAEAAAAVRFYSVPGGQMTGRYSPAKGHHVLALTFDSETDMFIGLLWEYESTAQYYIVHLSQTGEETKRFEVFDCYAIHYLNKRHSLLNAAGNELDWTTGQIVFRYEFPEKVE